MTSITHILESINTFSATNFFFSQNIDILQLVKHIPENVSFKLNDAEFISHLSKAQSNLDWLNNYFSKEIIPLLKKEMKKLFKKRR